MYSNSSAILRGKRMKSKTRPRGHCGDVRAPAQVLKKLFAIKWRDTTALKVVRVGQFVEITGYRVFNGLVRAAPCFRYPALQLCEKIGVIDVQIHSLHDMKRSS
jgi:hypothetical protein